MVRVLGTRALGWAGKEKRPVLEEKREAGEGRGEDTR